MKKKEAQDQDFHFYASSVAEWVTTTDTRTLPDVIQMMDKAGYPYSLWMVPGNWKTTYDIEWYAPKVEGAKFLGHFKTPKERKAEVRKAERAQYKEDLEVLGLK